MRVCQLELSISAARGKLTTNETGRIFSMLQLRKWLTNRHDWFELCLQQLAELEGYGHLSRPMVQLCAHVGKEPVGLSEIAKQMGVSRQWVARLANEGYEMGFFELIADPSDMRALQIRFGSAGWKMVRLAAARMRQIEAVIVARIGKGNLERLVEILSMDWGPAEISANELARVEFKARRTRGKRAA
jgi:DNA-binding MarR family transcriptional regulator